MAGWGPSSFRIELNGPFPDCRPDLPPHDRAAGLEELLSDDPRQFVQDVVRQLLPDEAETEVV